MSISWGNQAREAAVRQGPKGHGWGRNQADWRAGAGEGNRTLVVSLGSFCSTIELHPHRVRHCHRKRWLWQVAKATPIHFSAEGHGAGRVGCIPEACAIVTTARHDTGGQKAGKTSAGKGLLKN